jgi:hypothetical protein
MNASKTRLKPRRATKILFEWVSSLIPFVSVLKRILEILFFSARAKQAQKATSSIF